MDLFSGFAGLFLSIGSWFAPEQPGSLTLQVSGKSGTAIRVESLLNVTFPDEAEELIDAGVPIQVRYSCASDADIVVMTRTLRSNLADGSYAVIDSAGSKEFSKRIHSNVLTAAHQFKSVGWNIDNTASRVEITAEILPASVPRLSRTVDLSPLFGGKKFSRALLFDRRER